MAQTDADQRSDTEPTLPDSKTNLTHGERVAIVIENAHLAYLEPSGMVTFMLAPEQTGRERTCYFQLPINSPDVQIQRSVPADGVPKPGELWLDRLDTLYFASALRDGSVWLTDEMGDRCSWQQVHRGPVGPIRLHYQSAGGKPGDAP